MLSLADVGSLPLVQTHALPSREASSNAPPLDVRPLDARPLEPALLRTVCELLDWQLWYWGQDIHHEAGNALRNYGFTRVRGPDDGTQRSSAYSLTASATPTGSLRGLESITAWGFSVCALHRAHSDTGALVLVRHEHTPGLAEQALPAVAGTRTQLPPRRYPRTAAEWTCTHQTLLALAGCLADYEQWAARELGALHRQEAHRRRPRAVRRRYPQPPHLDDAWMDVVRVLTVCAPGVASPGWRAE